MKDLARHTCCGSPQRLLKHLQQLIILVLADSKANSPAALALCSTWTCSQQGKLRNHQHLFTTERMVCVTAESKACGASQAGEGDPESGGARLGASTKENPKGTESWCISIPAIADTMRSGCVHCQRRLGCRLFISERPYTVRAA